jgi:predicted phage terminase large subunit-like protein
MPDEALREMLQLIEAKHRLEVREKAQKSFMPFVHHVYDGFIEGRHHRVIAEKLEAVARGECKRLIINMPPRHSKSEFASFLMPAWFLGRNPKLKIIQATHNTDLAVRFGRKVRDLVADPKYGEIFPDTQLKEDSKSAGKWETHVGGEYFAAGVGAAVTGRGADLFIIDDPHALEITTPIPTPSGFVEIQHLQVGDEVFGPDGNPTRVVAKSEVWHDRELYSVTTSDGQEVLCDGGHLWGVNSDTCLAKARVENYTARYLAEWPLKNRPIIPRHNPVNYPAKDLPVDPWVLGAWLGDGTSSSGRFTAHPDDQPYIVEQLRLAGYEVSPATKDGFTFTAYGLMPQLRDLGVLNNKHVPEEYLTASVEQRLALLQGLMDTDGDVKKSGQCGFYNTNVALVDAVVELLHSLGVKAQRKTYEDKRGRWSAAQPLHRVMFRLEGAARMPRKAMYTRTPTDKRSRSITVEPTGATGSVQCITVDRPDGLFLAGRGYVVTHNSEQDALSETAFDHAYEWYTSGPRQRLQPGGSIILVMTRWGRKDLTGRLLANQSADIMADQWEVIEFPAILPSGDPLWPEFWDKDSLLSIKGSLPSSKWEAQWQQKPVGSGSAVIRKEWWKSWQKEKVPPLKYIIQAYDTAFSKKETADFSAITTWGVFEPEEGGKDAIILMDAQRGRWNFPELKEVAFEEYKYWEPDMVIVEAKASGIPLLDELQARGVPAMSFSPGRRTKGRGGVDKSLRVHLVSPLFEAGLVWVPQDKRFAEEVVDEVCSFPNGEHDDYVDSMTLALLRFRQGGFIRIHDEEEEDFRTSAPSRKREYY